MGQEEPSPKEEAIHEAMQEAIQEAIIQAAAAPPGSTPPQQSGGAGNPGGTAPTTPPGLPYSGGHSDPWAHPEKHYRSFHCPPTTRIAAFWTCSRFSKHGCDKSTFAIATWRGDAQRYWLTQVLDCARSRHDQWLQSTPSQRASLEPGYILGDRKHIPEAQNAVESVLRTALLDAIPKSIADACMRHGYCTAELIVWYVMKQLILPLDQGCAWLEEMQHRLNLCILDQGCAWLEEMQHRLQPMHQDEAKCASTNNCSVCQWYPQWHYSVLPYSREHLGQSLWQTSVERVQHHSWIGSTLCLQNSWSSKSCTKNRTRLLR